MVNKLSFAQKIKNFKKKTSNKKLTSFFIASFLLISLMFLFAPQPAHANPLKWIAGETVVGVLEAIAFFCKALVGLGAKFLAFLLQPNLYNFHEEEIIRLGWETCRNICNMFFLLVLLFIAFCTILQIDKYHAKKTLLTLILMALLINFSRPIAVFIFDGAQLLMNWFLKTNGNYTTTITEISKISDLLYSDLPNALTRWLPFIGEDYSTSIVRLLYTILFLWMYAVALFVLGIFLFIRIVAMWLIIIVSPFAFLAAAIPDFQSISSKWWNALFKYSYVGPAIAFFLFLSTRLAQSNLVKMAQNNQISNSNVSGDSIVPLKTFIPFIVILVFLYAAIIMAQNFGIQFASAVTGWGERAAKWGLGTFTGYRAARWGYKKAGEGVRYGARHGMDWFGYSVLAPRNLDPRAWWQAWQKRSAEVKEDKLGDAVARSQDTLSRAFAESPGVLSKLFKAGRKIPEFYTRKREAEQKAKYKKEQDSMGTAPEIVLPAMRALYENQHNMEPREVQLRALAYMDTLFSARDFNEARKMEFLDIIGMHKPMNSSEAPEYARTIMKAFGINREEDLYYHAKRFGETALAHDDGHLWALEERNPQRRNAMIYGKIGTIKEKAYAAGMHTEALHIKDNDGNVVGIQGGAWPHLRRWNQVGYTFLQEMRTQVKSDILSDGGIKAHKENYDRLNTRAESCKRKSEQVTDPARKQFWNEQAAEYTRQASDEKDMVAAVATKGGKNWTDSQIQANLDRIKALTNGGWDIKLKETSKPTGPTIPATVHIDIANEINQTVNQQLQNWQRYNPGANYSQLDAKKKEIENTKAIRDLADEVLRKNLSGLSVEALLKQDLNGIIASAVKYNNKQVKDLMRDLISSNADIKNKINLANLSGLGMRKSSAAQSRQGKTTRTESPSEGTSEDTDTSAEDDTVLSD